MSGFLSAGLFDAIPDNAIYDFLIDEGSGSTITDEVESETVEFNNGTWVSDSGWRGGFAFETDGIDDRGDLSNLTTGVVNSLTILITGRFEGSSDNGPAIWEASSSDGFDNWIQWENSADNTLRVGLTNESGSRTFVDSNTTLSANTRYQLGLHWDNSTLYPVINGSLDTSGESFSGDFDIKSWSERWLGFRVSESRYANFQFADMRWGVGMSEQDIQNHYNNQPWS